MAKRWNEIKNIFYLFFITYCRETILNMLVMQDKNLKGQYHASNTKLWLIPFLCIRFKSENSLSIYVMQVANNYNINF